MKFFRTREERQKAAEEVKDRLAASEIDRNALKDRHTAFLESVPDALLLVSSDGRIALVNSQLEALFGYDRSDLIGKDLGCLIPARFRAIHGEHVQRFLTAPTVRPMGGRTEIFGLKMDGTEFPADISLSPLSVDGALYAAAAIRDITERQQAEQETRRSLEMQRVMCAILKSSLEPTPLEAQLQDILDRIVSIPWLALQARGSIYVVEDDPECLVLRAHRGTPEGGQKVCGRIPFETCLCGKAAANRETVHAAHVDESHEIRYVEMSPHGHYCVPITYRNRTLGLINVHLKDGHGRRPEEEEFLTAAANTLAGIIERHRAQLERERLQKQLADAEKLAAVGRLTENVAHEIRNPLTSVGGFARRLSIALAPGSPGKDDAERIVTDVKRLEELLGNVLSYTQTREPVLAKENLHEILDHLLSQADAACRSQSVQVEKTYTGSHPVYVDRNQIEEALGYLITNAVDAMPRGGTLSVGIGRDMRGERSYAKVAVSDTGEGIPEKDLSMVFEPFFMLQESNGTARLGLPICRKIIEAHRGLIGVTSNVGEGSTFSVYLPSPDMA